MRLPTIDYRLRDLREADLADTADIWFRSWHAAFPDLAHPMPYEAWLPRLRDDIATKCLCRVAILYAAVIGFSAVDVERSILEQIFVAPEHQGAAVGRMLLDDAKRLCPSGLRLMTLRRNARATAFYERHGFEPGNVGINPVNGLPSIEYVWRPRVGSFTGQIRRE